MHLLILYNIIYTFIASIVIAINCVDTKKKGEKAAISKQQSPKKAPTPVAIQTNQEEALEKERKLRIAENREKMRKKREKQTKKAEEKSRQAAVAAAVATVKKEDTVVVEKIREDSKEMLPEDKTQSIMTTSEATESATVEAKMNKTQPTEDEKTKSKESNKGSSDEELGDVQLVDQDPDAEKKLENIKKQARKTAHEKELAELMAKSLRDSEISHPGTPDDTMKNVSSLNGESELSEIQRKRKMNIEKEDTKSGDTTCTTESMMVREATLIEPKSDPIYLRQLARTVLGIPLEQTKTDFKN